ncbi:MAG: acyltransferase family protein, partial [Peptostreptococcaceae bacterium]
FTFEYFRRIFRRGLSPSIPLLPEDTSTERSYLIDNLKGLLIFLVVFGHSLEPYKEQHIILRTIYIFIYLFHMPAFVFISGYLSKNLNKSRETALKNFLIPYMIFNTIWYIIVSIYTQNLSGFSFITPGWALWYLLSMFFWKLFLIDLVRIRYIIPLSILVGLFSGLFSEFDTTLSLSRTLVFLPFFLIGYFTDKKYFFTLKKPSWVFALCLILLALSFAGVISYFNIIPIEFLYGSESFKTTTVPIWIGLIGRIFMYVIGFSFVFILANIIPNRPSFFSKIGMNTFPIYLLHTYLLMFVFGMNAVVPSLWLKVVLCMFGTIGITALLSKNIVNHYFNLFLQKIYSFLLVQKKQA